MTITMPVSIVAPPNVHATHSTLSGNNRLSGNGTDAAFTSTLPLQ